MDLNKLIEVIEERTKVTQNLIAKLNEIWKPIIEKMEKEELFYNFSNGFKLEYYFKSSNYGNWYDLIINGHYLQNEEKKPSCSGYWAGNFNYQYEGMDREELLKLAKESKQMIIELLEHQQKKTNEVKGLLKDQ